MRAVRLRGRPDCAVMQSAFSETGLVHVCETCHVGVRVKCGIQMRNRNMPRVRAGVKS